MNAIQLIILILIINHVHVTENRLVGGTKARIGQFPFYAQILFNEDVFCGGSLIHPTWILSAAHCYFYPDNEIESMIYKKNISAVMGTTRFYGSLKKGLYHVRMNIIRIILHRNYHECYNNNKQKVVAKYDVSLLKTRDPFSLTKRIYTVKVPNVGQGLKACKRAMLVGTGYTTFEGNRSDYVMYAKTEIYERSFKFPEWFKSSTVFLSKAVWHKNHPLFGDSGGPFVCFHKRVPVLYGVITGVTNFTVKGKPFVVGTYESVEKHMLFIKRYVRKVQTIDEIQYWRIKDEKNEDHNRKKIKNVKAIANVIIKMRFFYLPSLHIVLSNL